ncbi:unnamed protein product, partial [marine sediment metagenome]
MKTFIKKETKTDSRDFRSLLGKEAMQKKVNIQKENPFQLAQESRFYGERIEVETVNQSFYPSAFVWRGQRYVI